jgi:hypothetical protein
MRCCHSRRWSTSVCHSGTRARSSSRCSGGIRIPRAARPSAARADAVALGALLGPSPRSGLGLLGQMHLRADRFELLDDELPARRRLQRHLQVPAGKAPNAGAVGGRDALRAISPVSVSSHAAVICARGRVPSRSSSGPPQAPRSTKPTRTLAALELRMSLSPCQDGSAHAIHVKHGTDIGASIRTVARSEAGLRWCLQEFPVSPGEVALEAPEHLGPGLAFGQLAPQEARVADRSACG